MTAVEYLSQTDYSPLPGVYILVSSGGSTFILNNKVYCTGTIKENGVNLNFYRTNDYDGRIISGLPHAIDFQLYHRREYFTIVNRLNKFFHDMVEDAEAQRTCHNSELVNLRINVNLIYKLPIAHEDKVQWADWIKELYWNRKALLNQWYIDNVLPF